MAPTTILSQSFVFEDQSDITDSSFVIDPYFGWFFQQAKCLNRQAQEKAKHKILAILCDLFGGGDL